MQNASSTFAFPARRGPGIPFLPPLVRASCHGGVMRSFLLASLLLLGGASTAAVRERPPTSAELARILGPIQTFEVTPPKGARSFMMSTGAGGPLAEFAPRGVLSVTVALLPAGCAAGERHLVTSVGWGTTGECLKLFNSYGTTTSFPRVPAALPLNRWIPLYAVMPMIPGKTPGGHVVDPDVTHWTLVSVYFSDQPEIEKVKVPDSAKAVDFIR